MKLQENSLKDIRTITVSALFTAALSVSSLFVIPVPFSPVVLSLQTVIVNLIALILKPIQAFYCVGIYLLMGAIGLPVFSGGTSGLGKLLGPTGGFYFGFLLSAVAISLLRGNRISLKRYLILTIAIGIPIQHLCAILMMCIHNGFDIAAAISSVSLPFILGDILKCVASCVIGVKVGKVLKSE